MSSSDYYTSERFIHDGLIKEVESNLESVKDSWRKSRAIDSFMVSWPAENITADDGTAITSFVLCELPAKREDRLREIQGLIEKTNPFALLLCEQREGVVRLILESGHGTKSWCFPIEKHGPDLVLGARVDRVDEDGLGILWPPQPSAG